MNGESRPSIPSPEASARSARFTPTVRGSTRLWLLSIVGIAIAYSPMWLPRLGEAVGIVPEFRGPASSILWNVLAVVPLLAYVLIVERRSLASLGLRRPRGKDLEWALILFGIVMAWQWVVRTFFPPADDPGTATISALPIVAVIGMIFSSAIFEEILYRGYPIERLAELTGRRWLAFALTIPLFVAPHLVFFGVQWLWTAGVGTIALYVLYARTRNLPACMLLHFCLNAPILIPTIATALGG